VGSEAKSAGISAIVPFRIQGTKPPLFLIHGVDGTLLPFEGLVPHLEPDRPLYGVQSQALLGETIALTRMEELAAYYLQAIQALQPHGPYHFLGFSFGGLVAFEMARQLRERGERVGMLGMLDNLRMGTGANGAGGAQFEDTAQRLRKSVVHHLKVLVGPRGLWRTKEKLRARTLRTIYTFLRARRRPIPRYLQRTIDINWFAAESYVPQFYPGSVMLFPARDSKNNPGATNDLWARLAGGVELHPVPGGHEDVLKEPNVGALAKTVTRCLANVDRAMPSRVHPTSL
jgi:thioesterase domain-containing protein